MTIFKICLRIIVVIILVAILIALFGYAGKYLYLLKQAIIGNPTATNTTYPSPVTNASPSVTVGNTIIPVEVARDYQAIQQGLSGRPYLDQNSGMLFIFPKASIYRFWMPDMNFPIDIFWINNGQVVGIEENMSPDFDPANPKYYSPRVPAQFVIEVNAGFARKHNIRVGDRVIFNNIQ